MTRGCGELIEGGVYASVELSPFGKPLEAFLLDPVLPIDLEKAGISIRQPTLRQAPGNAYYLLDVVGESYYPNVTDILEEIRAQGLSRRLELPASQYNLLQPDQEIILIHPSAFINLDGLDIYYQHRKPLNPLGYRWHNCPTNQNDHEHMKKLINCAGLHWNRVDIGAEDLNKTARIVQKTIGEVTYKGYKSPDKAMDLLPSEVFSAGAIARFRISNFNIVKSKDGIHHEKIEKLQGCDIPWRVIDK